MASDHFWGIKGSFEIYLEDFVLFSETPYEISYNKTIIRNLWHFSLGYTLDSF
jgi:hypothetical protein